jgi:DNA-binding GntR family transcriptional regulator
MLILELGNNSKLFQMVDQIYVQLIIRRTLGSLSPERPYQACDEHRTIFQALKEKNPKKAGRLMKDHIRNAQNCVLSDLENRKIEYQSTLVPLRSSEKTRVQL